MVTVTRTKTIEHQIGQEELTDIIKGKHTISIPEGAEVSMSVQVPHGGDCSGMRLSLDECNLHVVIKYKETEKL